MGGYNRTEKIEHEVELKPGRQTKQEDQDLTRVTKKRYIINRVNKDVSYYYINYDYPGFVWRNAFIFIALHLVYIYGFYLSVARSNWSSWLFSKLDLPC